MNKLQDRLLQFDDDRSSCGDITCALTGHANCKKEALTAIHTDLMELCGEDEINYGNYDEFHGKAMRARDELRAELRKKIDEYCGISNA